MPIPLESERSSILVKRSSFERAGLERSEIDFAFNLTDAEFQLEGHLIVIGPLPSDDLAGTMAEWLEGRGLVHFDDFFELSGNWPDWLRLFAMSTGP